MLQLKRVEIQGFKSFCDRAEMRFHGSGIAAIVGPNGCGKSNLSDAISWVLGEQSAKSLRGSRMEDVIFAGTKDRKPLGLASVTLTLAEPDEETNPEQSSNGHGAPAKKPQEITISRRLFRSGDSEYQINGRTARLRDIQDLFTGTGLGPESYAIIEQGRIGQILSTKPQERRSVIEEAAGITRFKNKRRLAEAKLEGAKQNLTRVFDILEEVGRQVTSLKRQAAKAKRYGELRAELVAQVRIALAARFQLVEREASRVAIELNRATSAHQDLTGRLLSEETATVQWREQAYRTEADLTEARKRLSEVRLDAERTRGRLEYQAKQVATIEQRVTNGSTESQALEMRFQLLQEETAAHGRSLAELDEQTESARAHLAEKEQERQRVQAGLREQERVIEAGRQSVLRLLGEANSLRNQLAQVDEFLASTDRDMARSQREEEAAAADLDRLRKVKRELSDRVSERQLALESALEQRKVVEEELAMTRGRAADTRRKLDQLRGEVSRLRARRDSIEDIISHRSYTTDSVKRLFNAIEKGQAQGLRPAGVLADFVEVEPTYERAAEEFLHDELEFVVVEDYSQAALGIDLMRSGVDGRATFLIRPSAEAAQAPEAPDLREQPAVTAKLTDVLRLTGGLSASFLPRLSHCYLAADREGAQQIAPRYPDLYFLLPDGICYHGLAVSGGKKTGAGPLALKREWRELAQAADAKQKELEQASGTLEGLEDQITELQEDLERLRGLQQTHEKDTAALNVELRKLGEELSRVNSRVSVARLELDRLRQQRERSAAQREKNQQLLEEREQARLAQEQIVQNARQQLEQLQSGSARMAEEHAVQRVELAGLEERRRAGKSTQARLETQLREVAQRRQQLAQELERLTAEGARLHADNRELEVRSDYLATEARTLEETVQQLTGREQVLRGKLTAGEELLKRLRGEHQAAQELRSHLEVSLVKHQAERRYLEETCQKELNTTLEQLAQGNEVIPSDEAIAEADQKYQEARRKIDALGPVNPQALEEFEEAQQRFDFLNAQRNDLLDSIRDTEKAIKDIDVESRRRFAEAFAAINIHFREMFKTLFGGGLGEMRLTDEENVIESGIEIVASPPNKKLQSVLLLSGGEKALTAMALLMAIFRYQPSPFCILDEVDAPLDEPNTERLTRLLREMAKQTQFVIITHSRRTMESAQVLYGVTMQEPGVSKLVSVKFQPLPHPEQPVAEVVSA